MNERIKKLAEQAGLAYKTPNGKYWIDAGYPDIHLERFAELVRQDEREQAEKKEPVCDKDPHLCWSVRCQLGKVCKNTAPPKREIDMSTKPEKIDTSAKRVHETDKSVHEPVTTIETACALLRQAHDVLSMSSLPPKREWVGLTDEEIVACGWCDLRFARAIEAKLRERNT